MKLIREYGIQQLISEMKNNIPGKEKGRMTSTQLDWPTSSNMTNDQHSSVMSENLPSHPSVQTPNDGSIMTGKSFTAESYQHSSIDTSHMSGITKETYNLEKVSQNLELLKNSKKGR